MTCLHFDLVVLPLWHLFHILHEDGEWRDGLSLQEILEPAVRRFYREREREPSLD